MKVTDRQHVDTINIFSFLKEGMESFAFYLKAIYISLSTETYIQFTTCKNYQSSYVLQFRFFERIICT